MKNNTRVPTLAFVFVAITLVFFNCLAWAGVSSIAEQHRTCKEDKDCDLIVLGCHCMYCARPEDLKNGVVDSVNNQFSSQFADLAKCSATAMRSCATAGACANFGKSIPVCQKQKCTIVFKAN